MTIGRMRRLLATVLVIALAAPAFARSEKTVAYQRDQVWPTVVRFLAVDEHVKVIEKDADAGYVLFDLTDDGKVFRGSLEIMTVVKDRRTSVKVVIQIEDRPSWQEVAMLTRLERKLRAELGSPAPPPAKDPPKDKEPAPDKPKDAPKPPDTDTTMPISPSP